MGTASKNCALTGLEITEGDDVYGFGLSDNHA